MRFSHTLIILLNKPESCFTLMSSSCWVLKLSNSEGIGEELHGSNGMSPSICIIWDGE